MKKKEWNEGLDHIDPDLVEKYVEQKDRLRQNKKPKGVWLRFGAIAACFVLIVGAVIVVPMLLEDDPSVIPDPGTDVGTDSDSTEGNGKTEIPIVNIQVPSSDPQYYESESSVTGSSSSDEDDPSVIPKPGTDVGTDSDSTEGNDRPNIPIVNIQASSSAPQYYGSESSADSSSSSEQANIVQSGISVTARFAEALPDTYTFFDDWQQVEFRLLRMEVITVLEGADVPSEFYFIVPTGHMTDYSLFDKLVFMDIAQYGYEYSLVYNKTQECAKQLEMVLFGYSNTVFSWMGPNITAFDSDDRFDMRLWESTERWKASTRHTAEYFGSEYFQSYTLQDAEEEARNSGPEEDYNYVHSLADVNGEAAAALDYIKSFENGIYVTALGGGKLFYSPEVQLGFRRYINGFATNESGMIYADRVVWSKARISEEDETKLPNLQAAVASVISAFEAGEIKPPHLQNANQEKLKSSAVFGWYAKTADGVIGIVRVSWYYEDTHLRHYYDDRYFDDAYYIIEYGSDECKPIDKDELSDRIGAGYEGVYIFTGDYDEYGKIRDMCVPMP